MNSGKRQLICNEIEEIKERLADLGAIHPGSITEQLQKCYNSSCKCMKDKNPEKHGPYHKLSFVYHGKPKCRFVKEPQLAEMQTRLENYKEFRALIDRWVELAIEQGKLDFFSKTKQ